MFKTRKGLLLILILFLMGWLPFTLEDFKGVFENPPNEEISREVIITTQAQKHILQGDDRGGGHQHGTGRACKSEFPQDWNAPKIIDVVEKVAANDNLKWMQQINGYYIAEENIEGIRVRVVLDNDKERVITAYPTNVKRNPCPDPANDNQSQ